MKRILTAPLLATMLLCVGCPKKVLVERIPEPDKDYSRPLPPGELALRKIDPADWPDFSNAWLTRTDLKIAIDRSLNYLSKPSSQTHYPYGEITHAHAVASLRAFATLLDQTAAATSEEKLQALRDQFDVYISVGCDDEGTVLYTGYYTPIFDASPVRTAHFKYPLYRPPANLVKDAEGVVLGVKDANGAIRKLPDRRTIETTRMFAGNELYWLADPFEVYIAHVQGSVILKQPDGQKVTVGYAATNGWDYISVGKALVADGKIAADKLSLQGMIEYFKDHPFEVDRYVWKNPRFIFFQTGSGAPRGSLNEPVMPYRSIATDKSIFPRACLAFIETDLPARREDGTIANVRYSGFALDQDTGGAIRAPGRCDVYMGIGPAAAELAGRTYREGRLYYLFLKPARMTPASMKPSETPPPTAGPADNSP